MGILKWVDCFNIRRLPVPIGTIPPAEAETNDLEDQEPVNMVA